MGRVSNAKEKLIDSAVQLISNRSYSSVGVQDLCNHAGVKKGSFYYFFDSKKQLTLNSLDAIWDFYRENILNPIFNSDRTFHEKLQLLMEKSYAEHVKCKDSEGSISGCPFGNLALEMSTQDEEIRAKIQEIFREWAAMLEMSVQKAVENGELPPDTDTSATSKGIITYIEGLSLMSKTFNNPEIIKKLSCVLKKYKCV